MTERFPSPGGMSADPTRSRPATPSGSADARQHHALAYLSCFAYPVELRTLATYIAAEERNIPTAAVSDRVREGVVVALHHVDIPRLVAAGAVRYDPESRMVVADETNSMERYVDIADGFRSSDAA